MQPNRLHLAYVAGIFDGEGTIGIYGVRQKCRRAKKKLWAVRAAICGVYKPMIERLRKSLHMGSVSRMKRQELQRTPSRTYDPRLCRQSWRWQICSRSEVLRFIGLVYPYLLEKRKQAQIARAFILGRMSGERASALCKKAKKFEFAGPERLIGPRSLKGEESPVAKLTVAKVERIRRDFDSGLSMCRLAKKYALGETHVHRIIKNEAWHDVPYRCSRPVLTTAELGDKHPTAKLKESDVRAIRRGIAAGYTHAKLSKRFNISQTQISLIRSEKAWRCVE